ASAAHVVQGSVAAHAVQSHGAVRLFLCLAGWLARGNSWRDLGASARIRVHDDRAEAVGDEGAGTRDHHSQASSRRSASACYTGKRRTGAGSGKQLMTQGVAYHDGIAEEWDKRYETGGFARRASFFRSRMLPLLSSQGRWLDAACGSGYFARMLAERGAS